MTWTCIKGKRLTRSDFFFAQLSDSVHIWDVARHDSLSNFNAAADSVAV